jgi:hypothetical protein
MKKTLIAAIALSIAVAGSGLTANAAVVNRAAIEQELATLTAQLYALEAQAGMITPTPATDPGSMLGGDAFLNPASGNNPDTLSTDSNGNTHVVPMNERFWTLGDSGTSGQFASLQASVAQVPLLLTGNTIMGALGSTTILTTTTTMSPFAFLAVGTLAVMNSTSGVTSTINLPSLASINAVNPLVPEGKELQEVYNSSTANLVVNASSGIVFKNASSTGWPVGFSSSSVIIPPGGMMEQDGTDINSSLFIIDNTLFQ